MGQSHSVARGSQTAANYVHTKSSQSSPYNNIPSNSNGVNSLKESQNTQTIKQGANKTSAIVTFARAKFESRVGFTADQLMAIKRVGRAIESSIEDPDVQAAVTNSSAVHELSDVLNDAEYGDQMAFNALASNVCSLSQEYAESEGFVGHPGTIPNPINPFYKQIMEKIVTPLTIIGVITGGVVMGGTVMNALRSTSIAQKIMDYSYEYFMNKFVIMFNTYESSVSGTFKTILQPRQLPIIIPKTN